MIERIKKLISFKYFQIFLFGILAHGFCSLLFDMYHDKPIGQIIIRDDYTYAEFVFWVGQLVQDFIWLPIFYKVFQEVELGKYAVRFYLDLTLIDLGYLIFSNPYHFNRHKLEYIGWTVLFFIVHTLIVAMKRPQWLIKYFPLNDRNKEARPE